MDSGHSRERGGGTVGAKKRRSTAFSRGDGGVGGFLSLVWTCAMRHGTGDGLSVQPCAGLGVDEGESMGGCSQSVARMTF
jgi:hypothetical protein